MALDVHTRPSGPDSDAVSATSLTRRVLGGMGWVAGTRLAAQALQLVVGVVLARALDPAAFGLAATVYVFVGLAGILNDAGIARALLHKPEATAEDLSSAFWANVALGVVMAAVLSGAAPLIAAVYGQPLLEPMTWFVAAAFVLNVSVVPAALLERQLRYRVLALGGLGAAAAGTVATVVTAVLGAGPYSLVAAPAVDALVRSVLLFSATGWRPRLVVSAGSLRHLWSFSAFYTLSALLRHVETSAGTAVIGLLAGPSQLGYFARGQTLAGVPPQVTGMAGQAVLPALATRRRDGEAYEASALRAHGVTTLAGLLLVGLLVTNAHVLVPLLYGERWRPSVEILVWLGLAALLPVVAEPVMWSAFVVERTDLLFRWQLVSSAGAVLASAVGARWGALGIARALALCAVALIVPTLVYGARIWGVPMRRVLSALAGPAVVVSGAAGASLTAQAALARARSGEPVAQLAVSVAAFAGVGLLGARATGALGRVGTGRLPCGLGPFRFTRRTPRTHRPADDRFAYLVLAHQHPDKVVRLARAVRRQSPDADVLLAYNGRLAAADARRLAAAGVTRVGTGRPARWGSYSLVERTLEGLEAAREYAWVVLVSGQDYPVAPLQRWEAWLARQAAVAMFDARQVHPSDTETLNRTRLRWLVLTTRSRLGRYALRRIGDALPGRLRRRVFVFGSHCSIAYGRVAAPPVVWKGSQWMALSRAGVALVLAAAEDRHTRRPFRRSFAPDESFLQTIVATSGCPYLIGRVTMTRWSPGAAHPDDLGPEDLSAVLAASTPFARKLVGPRGEELADLVDKALQPALR